MPPGQRCTTSSASPAWCSPGEIVPALERGAIDGAGGSTATTTRSSAWTRWQVPLRPGMHEPLQGEFIINKAKWDALPADLKEIVKTSVQASYWNHFVRFQAKTAQACQELLAAGVKIIKTTDELNKGFLQAYDEVWQADAAKDEFYRKVIESQKKYSELVVPTAFRTGRTTILSPSTTTRTRSGSSKRQGISEPVDRLTLFGKQLSLSCETSPNGGAAWR